MHLKLLIVLSCLGMACAKKSSSSRDQAPESKQEEFKAAPKAQPLPDKQPNAGENQAQPKPAKPTKPDVITPDDEKKIKEVLIDRFPEVTLALAVKSASRTIRQIKAAGGRIDYDPNLGRGDTIPFIFVTINPRKLLDKAFVKSLDLKAVAFDHPAFAKIKPQSLAGAKPLDETYVPIDEVGLKGLRARQAGRGLGERTVVAVVDTGVDAFHPAFQDRVIFWNDATQEGRVPLAKVSVAGGKVDINGKKIALPTIFAADAEILHGVIDETAMGEQNNDNDVSSGRKGLDINNNKTINDKMMLLVGVSKDSGETVAIVDVDGDTIFSEAETKAAVMDFNRWRSLQRTRKPVKHTGKLTFPSTARTLSYPLNFEYGNDGALQFATLGMDINGHGTHVSGIIGGKLGKLDGAAPKTEFMALKVCSGITCTDAAIIRGLIKAFYNKHSLVPDAVNISLGSAQTYSEGIYDLLARDLGAKFGTTFFISASNSGPGYRSINDLGSMSPAVHVGAHVSKKTLSRHYNVNPEIKLPDHNLLFFSSVGPSYTGELKPNLVAPGSAMSATPTTDTLAYMYNGTSMSSPLAAGAYLAMLSLAKRSTSYQWYNRAKLAKLKAVKAKDRSAEYSLLSFPLLMRTLLEDTSSESVFKDYTFAQVGHGLMNVNTALSQFPKYMATIKGSGNLPINGYLFNPKVNDNSGARRLYERAVTPRSARRIELAVNFDGEEAETSLFDIGTRSWQVELVGVQVQATDGRVRRIDPKNAGAAMFSVGNTRDGVHSTKGQLILNNRIKRGFTSVRRPSKMKAGNVYLARYDISRNGVRVLTVIDVVHKPIALTDAVRNVYLPGLDPATKRLSQVYFKRDVAINASNWHRYPIAVSSADSELSLSVGFSPANNGRLLLQLYDPDGHEITYSVILNSEENEVNRRTSTIKVPTLKKKGIYEAVVSNYSGWGMVSSKYDLLIQSSRLKAEKDRLFLAGNKTKNFYLANPVGRIAAVKASVSGLRTITRIKKVPVVARHRTFAKLVLPNNTDAAKEFSLAFGLNNPSPMPITTRISRHLYKLDSSGKAVVAYTASTATSSAASKNFKINDTKEQLYVALETFNSVPEDRPIGETVKSLEIEATFPKVKPAGELKLTEQAHDGNSVFVFTITTPNTKGSLAGTINFSAVGSKESVQVPFRIN